MPKNAAWPFLTLFLLGCLGIACPGQGPKASSHSGAAEAGSLKAAVNEVKETLHGVEITDPYRWLEDQNSPETRAWIDAENAYTDARMARIPGREELKQKVAALLKIDTMSAPVVRNGRYFFSKRRADQDQA